MRGFLASSVGAACAAALVLPLTQPIAAASSAAFVPGVRPAAPAGPPGTVPEVREEALSGYTRSLPLRALADGSGVRARVGADPGVMGLPRRDVRPFSLVGVVWDDVDAELHGRVEVRTRTVGTGAWSPWQDLETHNQEHAADPGTPERGTGRTRGSTAPLWVGASDGIEVRVRPETHAAAGGARAAVPLPAGLRIDLVDPGEEPAASRTAELPALGRKATERAAVAATRARSRGTDDITEGTGQAAAEATGQAAVAGAGQAAVAGAGQAAVAGAGQAAVAGAGQAAAESGGQAVTEGAGGQAAAAKPYIGPRPRIVIRKGWGADERLRESGFVYTKTVKAAFVHHSATGNNYRCSQATAVLRSVYRYHVKSSGWRDFGYNFAVDKCGTIYEGRAGGVTRAVMGAHTLGFNTNSMGVAVLGTYTSSAPPRAAVDAVARLTAWKLGLFGVDPRGKVTLVSGGSNLYRKGVRAKLNVISGHRDGFITECPGGQLYQKLPTTRSTAARLQGR